MSLQEILIIAYFVVTALIFLIIINDPFLVKEEYSWYILVLWPLWFFVAAVKFLVNDLKELIKFAKEK